MLWCIVSIYMYLVAIVFILLIFIVQWVGRIFTTSDKIFPLISWLFRMMFRFMGIIVRVNDEEPLDKSKPYIFMPNHVSLVDVFLAGAYMPVYVNALEAHTHFKWPLYGWAIKSYGQIPINRNNPKSSWRSYLEAIDRIKKWGRSIIIFPEGTRSPDGKLQRFKKIPFKFAKEAGVDVVPVGFIGVEKLSPKQAACIKPVKIRINFGRPIRKEEIEKMTVEELSQRVYEEVRRLSEQD